MIVQPHYQFHHGVPKMRWTRPEQFRIAHFFIQTRRKPKERSTYSSELRGQKMLCHNVTRQLAEPDLPASCHPRENVYWKSHLRHCCDPFGPTSRTSPIFSRWVWFLIHSTEVTRPVVGNQWPAGDCLVNVRFSWTAEPLLVDRA